MGGEIPGQGGDAVWALREKQRASLQALADQWRNTAHSVAADLKGTKRGARFFKPTGIVKEKMGTQISVLLTCAAQLESQLK